MAYGNWGAFVYKNGERQENHEDNTPYHEKEYEPGYYQAFGMPKDKVYNPHHAVLGEKRVRLVGHKNHPGLLLDGKEVDLEPFKTRVEGTGDWHTDDEWQGEIEGYKFSAKQYQGNMIELYLTEPDGTVWNSTCGFEYGAGHME